MPITGMFSNRREFIGNGKAYDERAGHTGQARFASHALRSTPLPARRNAGFGTKTPPTYMASRRVKIIDAQGFSGWMSLSKARAAAAAGQGDFHRGTFYFNRAPELVLSQPSEVSSLTMPPLLDVVPFVCKAPVALQEGFLRYPQQTQTSVGPKFPGIECYR